MVPREEPPESDHQEPAADASHDAQPAVWFAAIVLERVAIAKKVDTRKATRLHQRYGARCEEHRSARCCDEERRQ